MSERDEEHDAFEDKKRRFTAAYESYWRFPGRGDPSEAAQWWNLLATVRLSDIDTVVEAVAREYSLKTAPRRGVFKAAIRRLLAARAEDLPPLEDCALCDNSGQMWCLGRMVPTASGHDELVMSADAEKGPLFRYFTPCTCLRGRRFIDSNAKLQQRILDWRETEFLPALQLAEKDYGQTTVGKFFAEDLIHQSYTGIRDEMAEKRRQKARVRFFPKPAPDHSSDEKSSQNEAQSHSEPVTAEMPAEPLPGGYDFDEVPF